MRTHRIARPLALAFALVVALAGCSDAADDAAGTDDAAPGQVQATGQSLDVDAFADLAAGDDVVLLDVRTAQEFAEGHLDGAVNLDVTSPDFTAGLGELDPEATYAVYCRSGNRSQTAIAAMRDAGFSAVADLSGGIQAWASDGRPVVTD